MYKKTSKELQVPTESTEVEPEAEMEESMSRDSALESSMSDRLLESFSDLTSP